MYQASSSLFWSSGILTGNQTRIINTVRQNAFWSSGILTGNQTCPVSRGMKKPPRGGSVIN